jgi:hypothetical protein
MREDSGLGKLAFWAMTALAILWAAGVLGALLFGLVAQPWGLVPILIALGPVALVAIAVIADRLRSPEDRHYSRDVHD